MLLPRALCSWLTQKDQLSSMHLAESDDPQTHLNDLKQHFELMMKRHDNLMEMGSSLSTTQLSAIIISSLPSSYHSAIQTITAAERIGVIQGTTANPKMTPWDLISFFTEEAQHHLIHDEHTKEAESALVADWKGRRRAPIIKAKPSQSPTQMTGAKTITRMATLR